MSSTWLDHIKRIQALAQSGLAYSDNQYDIERYEELRRISVEMAALLSDTPVELIRGLFDHETGYQTPKVDVRGVIFREGRLLMVREKLDGLWTPPGGWADIGLSPGENVVKEVREEAGMTVAPLRLLAVLDKKFYPHPPSPWHTYKMFILCSDPGGEPVPGPEILEARFCGPGEIPPLSGTRITREQVEMLFRANEGNQDAVVFD
jgi:ADP-ribose pyrophosphatase YjhB (NUDIX family)